MSPESARPRRGRTVGVTNAKEFNPIRGCGRDDRMTPGSFVPHNPGLFTFKPSGLGPTPRRPVHPGRRPAHRRVGHLAPLVPRRPRHARPLPAHAMNNPTRVGDDVRSLTVFGQPVRNSSRRFLLERAELGRASWRYLGQERQAVGTPGSCSVLGEARQGATAPRLGPELCGSRCGRGAMDSSSATLFPRADLLAAPAWRGDH